MRLRALVLAVGLLLPVSVFSQTVQQGLVLVTGNELFRYCSDRSGASQNVCGAYVAGVEDAVEVFNGIGAGKIACLQLHVTNDQLKDIVMQYLTAHPEARHLSAAGEVMLALQGAFPCK